jgi:hypothetical protein
MSCSIVIDMTLELLLLSSLGRLGSRPQSHRPWSASYACLGAAYTRVAIALSSTAELLAMTSIAGSVIESQVVDKHNGPMFDER